jgi:hypothetical protein
MIFRKNRWRLLIKFSIEIAVYSDEEELKLFKVIERRGENPGSGIIKL